LSLGGEKGKEKKRREEDHAALLSFAGSLEINRKKEKEIRTKKRRREKGEEKPHGQPPPYFPVTTCGKKGGKGVKGIVRGKGKEKRGSALKLVSTFPKSIPSLGKGKRKKPRKRGERRKKKDQSLRFSSAGP